MATAKFVKMANTIVTRSNQSARMIAVLDPTPTNKKYHGFLTHNWAKDEQGRNNHARVERVHVGLKKRGLNMWFDSERMSGAIVVYINAVYNPVTQTDCEYDGMSLQSLSAQNGYWRPHFKSVVFSDCRKGYSELVSEKFAVQRCCPLNTTTNVSICKSFKGKPLTESTFCTKCNPLYFAPVPAHVVCTVCPSGYETLLRGSTSCKTCPVGKRGRGTNQSCVVCSPGKYRQEDDVLDFNATNFCDNCPSGWFQEMSGKGLCLECESGRYQPLPQTTKCDNCGINFFTPKSAMTQCLLCPK